MFLNVNSKIINLFGGVSVNKAVIALKRDIANTCRKSEIEGNSILIKRSSEKEAIKPECFRISIEEYEDNKTVCISAPDELGAIYGVYHVSREIFGVSDFWFWNEQAFEQKEMYEISEDYFYESKAFRVRYRGWFVNDEVLLDDWKIDGDSDRPFEMAFETLLRCGGNMTIPGTDQNAHVFNKMASDMGLYVTHHHAEPLGAKMFARVYPDLEASYDKYPELFENLWKEGIEAQKDYKVIWNLGFRGQGDRPFWSDDPAYDTDEKRGQLISKLIRKQYELVKKIDSSAVCCSNLYGETMELYKEGFLDIPEDVILIWADNGFGKMVSRRQGNHNPRVYSLPKAGAGGKHGIYYHASFYDLQAAAMMTMLPNSPDFVVKELTDVYEKKADEFWIINCSNIKPHAYILDLISKIWRQESENADRIVEEHLEKYCSEYYKNTSEKEQKLIAELYRKWAVYSPKYGTNEDDHAGEQFAQHGARVLMTGLVNNFNSANPAKTAAAKEWLWFSDKKTLREQVSDYRKIVKDAADGYGEYLAKCFEVREKLSRDVAELLDNTFIWQVEYLKYSYCGALNICKAIEAVIDIPEKTGEVNADDSVIDCISEGRDKEGNPDYLKAFYFAGMAAESFEEGYNRMRSHEKGVFEGFFNNDCEADIRQSCFVSEALMGYLRFQGDGPHFYKWQRMFQKDAGGDKVHLILRVKRHITDKELFRLMKAKNI